MIIYRKRSAFPQTTMCCARVAGAACSVQRAQMCDRSAPLATHNQRHVLSPVAGANRKHVLLAAVIINRRARLGAIKRALTWRLLRRPFPPARKLRPEWHAQSRTPRRLMRAPLVFKYVVNAIIGRHHASTRSIVVTRFVAAHQSDAATKQSAQRLYKLESGLWRRLVILKCQMKRVLLPTCRYIVGYVRRECIRIY